MQFFVVTSAFAGTDVAVVAKTSDVLVAVDIHAKQKLKVVEFAIHDVNDTLDVNGAQMARSLLAIVVRVEEGEILDWCLFVVIDTFQVFDDPLAQLVW